jgi:hypothetical protein
MTPLDQPSETSDDLSVAEAAERIERILDGPPPEASQPELPSGPPLAAPPSADPRASLFAEFADVLASPSCSPAELFSNLAKLAGEQPARFERLQELMQAARIGDGNSGPPDAAQSAIEQARQLAELIPEWADPARASQELGEVRSFLLGQGVPQDYVATASDPRELAIARKAMLYDRAMAERSGLAAKRLPDAARVLHPGAAPETGPGDPTMERLRLRLKSTGRLDDAAAVIERMLSR